MTATNLMNKQQTRGDEMYRKKCLKKKKTGRFAVAKSDRIYDDFLRCPAPR